MKKIITLCFLMALVCVKGWGQVSSYAFNATAATYTAISGTTPALTAGSADEGYYNAIPLGFSFTFNGIAYTYAHVSTNGWLTLGTSTNNNAFSSTTNNASGSPVYTNLLATSTIATRPIIAPLWDDMSTTSLTYTTNTSGGTGNYITTIQYNNVKWNYQASTAVVSFQVKFYQATNAIQFVYTPVSAASINAASASIGIAGGTTGNATSNFLSVTDVTTAATANSSSETTSIAAVPASGITFTFTPPIYTAIASTDWNTSTTWSLSSGGNGVPTAGSTVVINGFAVTDAAAITAQPKSISINANGSLTFNAAYTNPSGSTISVASGSTLAVGAALTNSNTTAGAISISGTFQLNQGGTFTGANTTTSILTYNSGSTLVYNYSSPYTATDYEWTRLAGNRPTNVTINGGTITIASGERNIAGTLTLNGSLNLVGNLSSVLNTVANATATVSGSGVYMQTASGSFTTANPFGLGSGSPNPNGTLTTSGAITLPATTSFTFNGTAAQVTGTLLPTTIAALTISNAAGVTISNSTLTISGTTTLTNGALVLPAAANNLVTFNAITSAAGTLTGSPTSNISTLGTGTVSFTANGNSLFNWRVGANFGSSTSGLASVADIYGTFSLPAAGSISFYTTSSGGLNIQPKAIFTDSGASNNKVLGAGSFTVQPASGVNTGGTVIIGNTGGLTANGASGAIQTATRNFSGGANYTFNYAGSQAIGDALDGTSGTGKTGPITGNVLVAGGTSLTLNAGTTIIINSPGSFTLGSSSLASTLIAPATSVINGSGNVTFLGTASAGSTLQTANTGGVDGTFAGSGTFSLTNGTNNNTNFTFNGTIAQVTGSLLPATINNLTFSNTFSGSAASPSVTLSSSVATGGTITFTGGLSPIGLVLIGAGNTLTINGAIVLTNPNKLLGTTTSNLVIGGSGAINTSGLCYSDGFSTPIQLGNFTMNRSSTTVYLGSPVTVNGTFNLTNGIVATGGTLTLSGSINFGINGQLSTSSSSTPLVISGPSTGTITGSLIGSTNPLAFTRITMNRAGKTLTLGSNVTVSNSIGVVLTAGNISLDSYNLTNTGTGSLGAGSTNSMIVATGAGRAILTVPSGASTQIFPIGDGTNYTPATITFTAKSINGGTLGCYVVPSAHPNLNTGNTPSDYLKRYWSFSSTLTGTYTYSGTFTYVAGDIVGTETNIKADRWDGTSWSEIAGSSASSNTLTTASGLTNATAPFSAICDYTGRVSPVITLSSNTLAAGNIVQNTTVNPVYSFAITAVQSDASLTGLSIITGGTFNNTDISNLKVYSQTSAVFNAASTTLLSTLNAPATTNPKTFPTFGTPLTIPVGTTRYIFITADIACATIGNTVSIKSGTPIFAAGSYSPLATAEGNLKTIVASTPNNVASLTATATSSSSISVSWAAPASCYTQVMIVASPAANTGGTPTGDGSNYPTASLTYGSGTPFGNGYVVYKGTASPEVISNLSSNTTYFFKIFTNNGTLWTTGIEVSATTNDATLVTDYFRSISGGAWGSASNWQSSHNGIIWIAATTAPTSSATSILLQNPYIIAVAGTQSGAQMVISSGATLSISGTFTLANGANAIDCDVFGTIINSGTLTTTGVLAFESTGSYTHNEDGGTIPTATWNSGSTCNVIGITSATSFTSGVNQTFSNFTWNCTSQSSGSLFVLSADGSTNNTGTMTITGTLVVASTGPGGSNGYLALSGASRNTLPIGTYVQTGGVVYVNSGASATRALTVSNSFTLSGGIFALNLSTGGNASATVSGLSGTTISGTGIIDMDQAGSTGTSTFQTTAFTANGTGFNSIDGFSTNCSVDFGSSSTANSCLFKISGNFSHSSSNVFYTSSPTKVGSFIFNGNATDVPSAQTLSYTGTGSDYTSYVINSGTYVRLLTGLTLSPNNSTGPISSFIVNGTLDCNTFTLATGGTNETFALNSGATLVTANPNGVYSGTTGSISNAFGASATFNSSANYVFNGAAAQVANFNNTTMNNLGIANTAGAVTLNAPITVGGNVLINNNGGSLTGGSFFHTVKGNWANSGTYIANTGTVSFAGTSLQILNGTTTFNNLTFANSAGFTLNNTQTVGTSGILTLMSGVVNITSGLLSVANTSATAISGGSASAYVNGPLRRALPSVSTASSSFGFPVGKGGYYPFILTPSLTTTPVITAEAFNANSGGTPGTGLCSISNTEYWLATVNSGTFSNGTVSLTRPSALGSLNVVGKSSTVNGTYTSLGGTVNSTTITSTNASGISGLVYFVMGAYTPITAFTYTTPVSYCVGQSYTNTPAITGTATSFAVIGTALPAGLSLNTSTGVISGMPTTQTAAANYTIRAANACSSIDAVVNITINPNGSISLTSGTGTDAQTICSGSSFTIIYSVSGASGASITGGTLPASYGSYNNGVFTITGTPVVTNNTTYTYTVTTTGSSCNNASVSGTITVKALPEKQNLNITGNIPYCVPPDLGKEVKLNSSQTGVSYQLYQNGNPLADGIVTGTGSEITFGVRKAGTYTVFGTFTTAPGCPTEVENSSLTLFPQGPPVAESVTADGTVATSAHYCIGGSGVNIGLDNTQTDVLYQLFLNGNPVTSGGNPVTVSGQDGMAESFGNQTAAGTYSVQASGTCGGVITMANTVTVLIDPFSVAGTIGGAGTVCTETNSTALTLSGYTGMIQWQSSTDNSVFTNISGATSSTYTATNLTATTYYRAVVTSGSCSSATTSSVTLTVNPNASAGTVSGTSPLCIGATATYTASSVVLGGSGTGAWSSSNTAVATVNPATGVVTAIGSGTADIIYTVTGGCGGTASAQQSLTVSPNANAGTVSGTTPLCSGSTATYTSDGDAGGAWSSTNTNVATVDPSAGIVTTVNAGTTDITYTVNTGCNAPVSAFTALTVTASPSAAISYTGAPFCTSAGPGSPTISGTTGGTFSSTTGLSITPAGVITPSGSTPGTYTVTYTVAASGGCAVYTATTSVTINALPVATVAAANSPVCAGSGGLFTITGTPGSTVSYNLSSGGSSSKLLDGSGTATVPAGFISGSITITLTNVSASASTGGCTSTPAGAGSTATITTTPLPVAENLTGGGNYCQGGTGVPVGLSSSESGVSYQLLVDDGTTTSLTGSPAAGNGGVISFGNQTTTGTYSVQATNTTTGCVRTGGGTTVMVGYYTPATITADAAPATQTVCQNGTPADLTVTAVGNNLVYQWYSNTTSTTTGGTAIANTNSSSYTPVTTAPGTLYYYVTVTGPCRTVTSSAVPVTISALPTASFTSSSYSACGSSVGIGVSGTNGAIVNYSFTGPNSGSGSVMLTGGSATTDGTGTINSLSSPGTYNYTITSITNGCTGSSGSTTTATIDPAPSITLSSAAGTDNQSICKGGQITTITYSVTSGGTPTVTGLPAGVTSSYGNGVFTIGTPTGNTPTVTGVYPYTITVPGGACGTPVTISGVITASVSWNPIGQSVDWNTGSNWCSGFIPTPGDYVMIPANKPSPVLSGNVEIGSLDLAVTRTVSIGSYTLQVNGAITGAGTLTGSSSSNLTTGGTGTVNFTQTTPGTTNVLQNLAVTGGTLTLSNALNITAGNAAGVVTVSGTGQLATGNNLTLKSDMNGTASVAEHTGTTHITDYITGAVTTERFTNAGVTAGKRAWRLMTSPVTDQTINEAWQEGQVYDATAGPNLQPATYGTIITGQKLSPGTGSGTASSLGFDYVGGGNNASIKRYDPISNAWVPLPNTNNTLVRGAGAEQAYMLFIRGDRTQSTPTAKGPDNLHPTGTLLQGPQTVTVPGGNAFTLVGNPYAAPLDFAAIIANSNNATAIRNELYVWDTHLNAYGGFVTFTPSGGGGYSAVPVPVDAPSGSVHATQYIQSGEGFFVVPENGGTLTITEDMKNTTTSGSTGIAASPFRVVPSKMKELRVNLNLKGDSPAILADGFLARFDDYYSDTAAQQEGSSRKAWNFNENLNLVRNGKSHIIEAHSDVQKTDTLFMQMWYVTKRSYQLQMRADNFTAAPGIQAWLIDNYSGTKQEISLSGNVVSFDFAVTSDSLSWKSDRFMIVFQNNSAVLPVTLTNVKAILQNGGVTVSWTVSNEVNMKGYTVERSTDGGRTYTAVATQAAKNITGAIVTSYAAFDAQPETGDNLYRIRIEGKDGGVAYSGVVSVSIGATGNIEIAVYPNPVREGKVNLQLTNLAAGTYLVSVYSEGGQPVYQKKVTISQPSTTQSEELRLGKGLAQGSYQLRIADSQGSLVKETRLIIGR